MPWVFTYMLPWERFRLHDWLGLRSRDCVQDRRIRTWQTNSGACPVNQWSAGADMCLHVMETHVNGQPCTQHTWGDIDLSEAVYAFCLYSALWQRIQWFRSGNMLPLGALTGNASALAKKKKKGRRYLTPISCSWASTSAFQRHKGPLLSRWEGCGGCFVECISWAVDDFQIFLMDLDIEWLSAYMN